MRPSYLYDGNPHAGKTMSFYWDHPGLQRNRHIKIHVNWWNFSNVASDVAGKQAASQLEAMSRDALLTNRGFNGNSSLQCRHSIYI